MTKSSGFIISPIIFDAFFRGFKSGVLNSSIGVGKVTMKIFEAFISSKLYVNERFFELFICSFVDSLVLSVKDFNSSILLELISKPIVLKYLPNSMASGSPTYS